MSNIEIFGYLASVTVAISLMMKNIVKLRLWNLAGAAMFSIYGAAIGAWPVFVLNGWIAVIDLYYYFQMKTKKDFFEVIEVQQSNNIIIDRFLDLYKSDILNIFPQFTVEQLQSGKVYLILRNLMPVGIIQYEFIDSKEVMMHLDYVSPGYRDLRNAHYLYTHKTGKFSQMGISKIKAYSFSSKHQKYLSRLGFIPTNDLYKGQKIHERTVE